MAMADVRFLEDTVNGITILSVMGPIDDHWDWSAHMKKIPSPNLQLDLRGVSRMVSNGVRAWIKDNPSSKKATTIVSASEVFVNNLIANPALVKGTLFKSWLVPYRCSSCGRFESKPFEASSLDSLEKLEQQLTLKPACLAGKCQGELVCDTELESEDYWHKLFEIIDSSRK